MTSEVVTLTDPCQLAQKRRLPILLLVSITQLR